MLVYNHSIKAMGTTRENTEIFTRTVKPMGCFEICNYSTFYAALTYWAWLHNFDVYRVHSHEFLLSICRVNLLRDEHQMQHQPVTILLEAESAEEKYK